MSSLGHLSIIFRSSLWHLGVFVGAFLSLFESSVCQFYGIVRTFLESVVDHPVVIRSHLGCIWVLSRCHWGVMWGSTGCHLGVSFVVIWGHLGVIGESSWGPTIALPRGRDPRVWSA